MGDDLSSHLLELLARGEVIFADNFVFAVERLSTNCTFLSRFVAPKILI
jgi:hypothetical protein